MKTTPFAGLFLALLFACQIPGPLSVQAPQTAAGTASLKINVQTNGARLVPVGTPKQNGRFILAPQPGIATFTLSDPNGVLDDLNGDSTAELLNIPSGTWDLTVVLKNASGSATLGTTTLTGVSLSPGANTIPVTIPATQNGTGGINVQYEWGPTIISGASFSLYRLTLSGSGLGPRKAIVSEAAPPPAMTANLVSTPSPVVVFDEANRTVSYSIDNLASGSYKLVLQLSSGAAQHPQVTATVEVYDDMVSDYGDVVFLTPAQLSGPPEPIASVSVTTNLGRPYITWPLAPSTATGFSVYRNGSVVQTLGASMSSFSDSGYTLGGLVDYMVEPFNSFGSAPPTPGNANFQSVGSFSTTPASLRMGVDELFTLSAVPAQAGATIPGVTWSSAAPRVAAVSSSGQVRGNSLGQVVVSPRSDEALVTGSETGSSIIVDSVVTTLAGLAGVSGTSDGTGSGARLTYPTAVAYGNLGFDQGNYIYSFDYVSGVPVLRLIDEAGNVSTPNVSGTLPSGPVVGAVSDNNGGLFFTLGHAIYHYTVMNPNGEGYYAVFAGDFATPGYVNGDYLTARFSQPQGLVLTGGYLYVADSLNNRIRRVSADDGNTTDYAGDGSNSSADGPLINSGIYAPTGIAYDGFDNFYVASLGAYTVRQISISGGSWSTIAGTAGVGGSADGAGTSATFGQPGTLVCVGNTLYLQDGVTVRKILLPGPTNAGVVVSTVAGNAGDGSETDGYGINSRMGLLSSIASSGGALYLADNTYHTVRKVLISPYDLITVNDPRFTDPGVMKFYYTPPAYNRLLTGDGITGPVGVGTVLLFNDNTGNNFRSKVLISGIDRDYGGTGVWRLHLEWTTWHDGLLYSQGSSRVYTAQEASSGYFHLWTGGVDQSEGSDGFSLGGTEASSPAIERGILPPPYYSAGIYQ